MVKYIKHKCPKCRSRNITPFGKRAKGRSGICRYVCEECKHTWGPVVYATGYALKVHIS